MLIMDCEGFDNSRNVDIIEYEKEGENQVRTSGRDPNDVSEENGPSENDAAFRNTIVQRQDVLLFFTLALYS